MSYAAVIHGAKGIIWYTYGSRKYVPGEKLKKGGYGVNSTPERWKIITALAREFKQLAPVLTSRTPEKQPQIPTVISGPTQDYYGEPSISCLLKKHNGKNYLFAVNAVRKPVSAQFRLPGFNQGKVLFENRSIQVKNGILSENFKPYEVHVYEF